MFLLLLLVPLGMALWFAPALVALNGIGAAQAMLLSFQGCLKNILPFLLYSIVAMTLLVIAVIPVGLGLLVAMPMLTASMYIAYRDIFTRSFSS